VPSIRRYVIVEYRTKAVLLFHRAHADASWTAQALTAEESLPLPEVGIDVPIAEFYEDVEFPSEDSDPA
jgi:hypothetical protein